MCHKAYFEVVGLMYLKGYFGVRNYEWLQGRKVTLNFFEEVAMLSYHKGYFGGRRNYEWLQGPK